MNDSIPQPTMSVPAANAVKPLTLSGRVLAVAQAGWWIVFGGIVLLNLMALPPILRAAQRECVSQPCFDQQLTLALFRSWLAMGLSRELYAALSVGIAVVPIVIYLVVALVLFLNRPNEPIVIFTALMLATFGGVSYPGFMPILAHENALLWYPILALDYIGSVTVMVFFYIFPNGKFVPRLTIGLTVFWVVEQFLEVLNNPPVGWMFLSSDWINASFLLIVTSGIFAQVYRYRRVQNAQEHRQTKWVVVGTIAALVSVVVILVFASVMGQLRENVIAVMVVGALLSVAVSLIPLSIGIAILRARLWDINLIINRALVYGTVTAILAGVLAVSSDLAKRFFLALTGTESEFTPIVATLLVVAAFEPIRKRVQSFADRHVKYATGTLGAFADEVSKFVQLNDPDALARRFLNEALTSFEAQSGAIYLGEGAHMRLVSSAGEWKGHAELAVPLEHGGAQVGLIALGTRGRGTGYDAEDRANLKQLGDLVAHAIDLAKHVTHESGRP